MTKLSYALFKIGIDTMRSMLYYSITKLIIQKAGKTMAHIEDYKMTTGFYDEAKIMVDGGADARAAAFDDIFGDAQGAPILTATHQALLAEARFRNASLISAAKAAKTNEAQSLVSQPEPWSKKTWRRLVEMGYASRCSEDGGEQGYMSSSLSLTEAGERLLNPSFRANAYGDQVGIDG